MDVLSPDLMWIDGRCYRVPTLDPTFSIVDIATFKDCDLEEADDMIGCEEDVNEVPEIEILQNGRLRMVFAVARAFLPFIIGSKGATIKRISKDTSCNIVTPKFSEEQNITIIGPSKNKVILAWKSIIFVIKSSRNKIAATHFFSIPLTGKDIQENYHKFKEDVLSVCNDRGISEDIFQAREKLHITITAMTLLDEKERKLAEEKLIHIYNDYLKSMIDGVKPCILEVRGLETMNDDPSEVRVLYANVKIKNDDDLLQDMCNRISDSFKPLGLMKDESRSTVKIHLTLMNVSFLMKNELDPNILYQQEKMSRVENKTFDASNILKKYKDFYFGEQELKSIHLSTRFTVDEDGYYKHAAVVEF